MLVIPLFYRKNFFADNLKEDLLRTLVVLANWFIWKIAEDWRRLFSFLGD